MKILEPEWAIPLPEKTLDGCIDDENIFILAKVKISSLRFSKNFEVIFFVIWKFSKLKFQPLSWVKNLFSFMIRNHDLDAQLTMFSSAAAQR